MEIILRLTLYLLPHIFVTANVTAKWLKFGNEQKKKRYSFQKETKNEWKSVCAHFANYFASIFMFTELYHAFPARRGNWNIHSCRNPNKYESFRSYSSCMRFLHFWRNLCSFFAVPKHIQREVGREAAEEREKNLIKIRQNHNKRKMHLGWKKIDTFQSK